VAAAIDFAEHTQHQNDFLLDAISTINAYPAYLSQMNAATSGFALHGPTARLRNSTARTASQTCIRAADGRGRRNYVQYVADYNVDWDVNGSAAGLATDGGDAVNGALSGVFEDDLYFAAPVAETGLALARRIRTDAPDAHRTSVHLQRMQADKPGILALANLSNAQNPSNSWLNTWASSMAVC